MSETSPPAAYTGTARNYHEDTENKIHSDAIAAKFGFQGALVPGVTVFGLTSIPLTRDLGPSWLTGNTLHTRFLKPAYHGDVLDTTVARDNANAEAHCNNADQVLLCTLQVIPGVEASQLNDQGFDLAAPTIPVDRSTRPVISWDTLHEDQPFPVRPWQPSSEENTTYAAQVDDTHPAFTAAGDGLIHPHLLLSQANTVLVDEFQMPAWIHVGSEVRLHQPLRTDVDYRVFAKPVRKWKHKGHEFVTVYIAYEHNGQAVTEVLHTAIYRVAGA